MAEKLIWVLGKRDMKRYNDIMVQPPRKGLLVILVELASGETFQPFRYLVPTVQGVD